MAQKEFLDLPIGDTNPKSNIIFHLDQTIKEQNQKKIILSKYIGIVVLFLLLISILIFFLYLRFGSFEMVQKLLFITWLFALAFSGIYLLLYLDEVKDLKNRIHILTNLLIKIKGDQYRK